MKNLKIGEAYTVTTYNLGINKHNTTYQGFSEKTETSNEVHYFKGAQGIYCVLADDLDNRVS